MSRYSTPPPAASPEGIDRKLALVKAELTAAMALHAPMASAHEGYATILEELDELWDEVKKKPEARTSGRLRMEALQVAAMAVRFLIDVCDD